jgi:hypothetical protein
MRGERAQDERLEHLLGSGLDDANALRIGVDDRRIAIWSTNRPSEAQWDGGEGEGDRHS